MIAVIIAGGSGSRLWPLSTPEYPKHLLKITNDKSLLQNTFARARQVAKEVYIISEASHVEHVYEQFPKIAKDHVIVEPGRRGTASCVIAALARIKQSGKDHEPIVFMHADHHIQDVEAFIDTLENAAQVSEKLQKLVLLGVKPTFAATGFGYIERGQRASGQHAYEVLSFKEKPDSRTAQRYVAAGKYLWNMGYFIAPLNVFEQTIEMYAPTLWDKYQSLLSAQNEQAYTAQYLAFASEPIDTALIEKVQGLLVVPGEFDWMDVGSYPDVHQVNLQDDEGNTLQGKVEVEDLSNSYVRNDTDIPLAVIGLDNVVVVSTPEGILVTNKTHAQRVGDVSKRLAEVENT